MQKISLACGLFLTLFGQAKISNKKPIFFFLSMQNTVKTRKKRFLAFIYWHFTLSSSKLGSLLYNLENYFTVIG